MQVISPYCMILFRFMITNGLPPDSSSAVRSDSSTAVYYADACNKAVVTNGDGYTAGKMPCCRYRDVSADNRTWKNNTIKNVLSRQFSTSAVHSSDSSTAVACNMHVYTDSCRFTGVYPAVAIAA